VALFTLFSPRKQSVETRQIADYNVYTNRRRYLTCAEHYQKNTHTIHVPCHKNIRRDLDIRARALVARMCLQDQPDTLHVINTSKRFTIHTHIYIYIYIYKFIHFELPNSVCSVSVVFSRLERNVEKVYTHAAAAADAVVLYVEHNTRPSAHRVFISAATR